MVLVFLGDIKVEFLFLGDMKVEFAFLGDMRVEWVFVPNWPALRCPGDAISKIYLPHTLLIVCFDSLFCLEKINGIVLCSKCLHTMMVNNSFFSLSHKRE